MHRYTVLRKPIISKNKIQKNLKTVAQELELTELQPQLEEER